MRDDEFDARRAQRAARRTQRSGQAPAGRGAGGRVDAGRRAAATAAGPGPVETYRTPRPSAGARRASAQPTRRGDGAAAASAASVAGRVAHLLWRGLCLAGRGLLALARLLWRGIVAFVRWAVPACRRYPKRALALAGATAALVVVLNVRGCILSERQAALNAAATSGAQVAAQAVAGAATETAHDLVEPSSTPRDQWERGQMPYLYQIDPQWSHETYSGGRLRHQGCGPTALSMVYADLTGKDDKDPAAMAEFATECGYSTDQSGTSWSLMTVGAGKLGLYGKQLTPSESALRAELKAGRPVICIMNPGHFTSSGHFIVVEKLDEAGKAVVHDSNSWARSQKTWDLSTVASEAASAWSFQLA